jgi:hypothetical protein
VSRRTILVVEDGTEYIEAFRRLAPAGAEIELLHAADAESARRVLSDRRVDGVFLDVDFSRTPPEDLAGDLERLADRFSGDRDRARAYLASNQGFFIASLLAPALPKGAPVLLARDFSAESERLAALRERIPTLEGVEDGAPISKLLERLLRSKA